MAIGNLIQRGRVVVRQLAEGTYFTLNELKSNKFRTFLSLLSVSIGIFTIVAILTAVDTLDKGVRKSLEDLNTNQVSVSKWPMAPEDESGNQSVNAFGERVEYRWWDFMKRPPVTYDDYKFLKDNLTTAKVVTYSTTVNSLVKRGRKSISNCSVVMVTEDYNQTNNIKIAFGRDISPSEFRSGAAVAVIGNSVAQTLFGDEDVVGKQLNVGGYSLIVVGVLEMEGEGMLNFSGSSDSYIYIPFVCGRQIFSLRKNTDGDINAVAAQGYSNDDLCLEIRNVLRNYRRLRPTEKLNFSVNQLNLLEDILEGVISSLTSVGWIIALFSLLIGGFGIANIMFVSVKERTRIIGIQKALGAKKYFIMIQFLAEALILAVAGALVGLVIVWLIILVIPVPSTYDVSLSLSNVFTGILIAAVIGILSGVIPAYSAANLNPVDAINSK